MQNRFTQLDKPTADDDSSEGETTIVVEEEKETEEEIETGNSSQCYSYMRCHQRLQVRQQESPAL
jgi:ribosomal protein S13